MTTNRKRTKKITVRDAEPNRTRSHHEQQRQGQGKAKAVGGSSVGPERVGLELRVTQRQAWSELRRAPRPAAVLGAAPDAFVIPELRLLSAPPPPPALSPINSVAQFGAAGSRLAGGGGVFGGESLSRWASAGANEELEQGFG